MTCHPLPAAVASTMQNSIYQRKSCPAVKAFETQSFRITVYTVRKTEQVSLTANWSKSRGHRSFVPRSCVQTAPRTQVLGLGCPLVIKNTTEPYSRTPSNS